VTPPANFDNIFNSLITFFEIQTLSDWEEPAFRAMDAADE